MTLTLGWLFGKDVTAERLSTLKATLCGALKAFGSTTIGLHFWHINYSINYTLLITNFSVFVTGHLNLADSN